ncbi:MAG: hypothetical protein IKG67_01890 [Parasporobacterium sp.]|nr:hypothetical protein [Parasporobacterium sp.]
MSPDLTVTGSLSFLLDIIPIVVIIIVVVAIVLSRHNYLKEKKELHTALRECEEAESNNKERMESGHE